MNLKKWLTLAELLASSMRCKWTLRTLRGSDAKKTEVPRLANLLWWSQRQFPGAWIKQPAHVTRRKQQRAEKTEVARAVDSRWLQKLPCGLETSARDDGAVAMRGHVVDPRSTLAWPREKLLCDAARFGNIGRPNRYFRQKYPDLQQKTGNLKQHQCLLAWLQKCRRPLLDAS